MPSTSDLRRPQPTLSAAERKALSRIGRGFARHVPVTHQDTLVSLGLAGLDMGGRLVLTAKGQRRVRDEGE